MAFPHWFPSVPDSVQAVCQPRLPFPRQAWRQRDLSAGPCGAPLRGERFRRTWWYFGIFCASPLNQTARVVPRKVLFGSVFFHMTNVDSTFLGRGILGDDFLEKVFWGPIDMPLQFFKLQKLLLCAGHRLYHRWVKQTTRLTTRFTCFLASTWLTRTPDSLENLFCICICLFFL
jgi:hypothetical protein